MLRGGDEAWWGDQSASFLEMIRRRLSAPYTFPENSESPGLCRGATITLCDTYPHLWSASRGSQMSLPRTGKHEVDQGTCLACGVFLGHLLWASVCF